MKPGSQPKIFTEEEEKSYETLTKYFNLCSHPAIDPRQDEVDKQLHDLDQAHPQPQAHRAPHLREEAGQAELQEVSPGHQHLARETERKGGKITALSSVRYMFSFHVCCGARQGAVGQLSAVKQVDI